jgi:hypothetical protein
MCLTYVFHHCYCLDSLFNMYYFVSPQEGTSVNSVQDHITKCFMGSETVYCHY